MPLGHETVKSMLNREFGAQTETPAATHYYALMSVMPGPGGGGVECSGGTGPYARVSKSNDATRYPTISTGSTEKYLAEAVLFSGLPAGTWKGIAIYDASSGGNLVAYGTFTGGDITTASGDSVKLAANSGVVIRQTS